MTDTYNRRCAVTHERTLPALDAAHIKPFKLCLSHAVNNGILLRSDLHKLFDKGYLTFTPNYRLEVSRRIREEFENGHEYYNLAGKELERPANKIDWPNLELLRWHNEEVFLG